MKTYTLNIWFFLLLPISLNAQSVQLQRVGNVEWNQTGGGYISNQTQSDEQVSFDVVNLTNVQQDFTVLFDEGTNTTGQGDFQRAANQSGTPQKIQYQLSATEGGNNNNNILMDFSHPNLQNKNVFTSKRNTRLSPNETRPLVYFIHIPENQVVPAGVYTDNFDIKLYSKSLADIQSETDGLEDTINVQLTITAAETTTLTLGLNRVNFGTPQANQEEVFSMTIDSNAAYNVYISSQESGKMTHTTPGTKTHIPYLYKLTKRGAAEGPLLTLSDQPSLVHEHSSTGITSLTYDNTLTLHSTVDPQMLVAGPYEDILTVEVRTP